MNAIPSVSSHAELMLYGDNKPTLTNRVDPQMWLFDGTDRRLIVGAFLLAWYVAYKSLGLF